MSGEAFKGDQETDAQIRADQLAAGGALPPAIDIFGTQTQVTECRIESLQHDANGALELNAGMHQWISHPSLKLSPNSLIYWSVDRI